jgi:hypothetical protein
LTARRPFLEKAKALGYKTPHATPTSELLRQCLSLRVVTCTVLNYSEKVERIFDIPSLWHIIEIIHLVLKMLLLYFSRWRVTTYVCAGC